MVILFHAKGRSNVRGSEHKMINVLATVILLLFVHACTDTASYDETVKPEGPVAKATAEPYFGEAPLDVKFNASDSYLPGGGALTYAWDFDDGSISEEVSPEHAFKFPGTYVVTVTVRDSSGKKDTTSVIIIVY